MDSRHLHRLHNRLSTLMSSKDRPPVNPSPRVQRLRPPLRCSPSPRVATLLPALWYSSRYQIFPVRWTWTRWRRRTFIHCSWPAGCSFNARGGCFCPQTHCCRRPLWHPQLCQRLRAERRVIIWTGFIPVPLKLSVQSRLSQSLDVLPFGKIHKLVRREAPQKVLTFALIIKVNTKKCAALG